MPGEGRRFQPGQSGNPGGRPKALIDVIDLARQHTADAVHALCEVASQADAHPAARVAAAVALLDRGWGRPSQAIESSVHVQQSSWVVRAPAPVSSTQEWLERYAPKTIEEQQP